MTLPNIRWALLYGVLLCNARAMGEFGAVSVVSGHIRGLTNTMPLHVEILYNEYNFVAAFAVASLLALLALVTLAAKSFLEWRYGDALSGRSAPLSLGRAWTSASPSIAKEFGETAALRGVSVDVARANCRAARPVGLGQDDAAAHHRGA